MWLVVSYGIILNVKSVQWLKGRLENAAVHNNKPCQASSILHASNRSLSAQCEATSQSVTSKYFSAFTVTCQRPRTLLREDSDVSVLLRRHVCRCLARERLNLPDRPLLWFDW